MWVVAALDAVWPAVRPVLCLHENVATGAADGYARVRRRPALTLLHLGPGLANGLANLHNARRARSPVVNLVGDMATWHRANDPPLNSPLESLAGAVSAEVVVVKGGGASAATSGSSCSHGSSSSQLAAAVAGALGHAEVATTGLGGEVVTVIIPHDLSWEPPPPPPPPQQPPASSAAHPPQASASASAPSAATSLAAQQQQERAAAAAALEEFVRDCADALRRHAPATAPAAAGSNSSTAGSSSVSASGVRRGAALYLGGGALLAEGGALHAAGQVAAATGATLLCEGAFARADRGAGLPALRRLPYFPHEAAAELARYGCVVLVDAQPPVANFGYRGAPGKLLLPDGDAHAGGGGSVADAASGSATGAPTAPAQPEVWEFDTHALRAAGWDAASTLKRLVAALGPAAAGVQPGVNCRGVFAAPRRPPLPPSCIDSSSDGIAGGSSSGGLTAAELCVVVAALQPEGCVVVDESLTSGGSYWEASKGCPPFTHLTLTGGAIGSGPPLALGAALALLQQQAQEAHTQQATPAAAAAAGGGASPGGGRSRSRRVINLQADGSAMYSLQALWSQAREALPVTTLICANCSYAILKVEAARQRLPRAGAATRALTDLSSPAVDWVALAAGMGVPGERVGSAAALAAALRRALAVQGPFLIQADLAT
ncbi:hypothetical protein HXX76_002240 [Chlamydomonas incerta]|uniref:Thiamine pyrophosphate enzyme TPP-binding domain-containing protein n=1 Tax=Chlamydomonas incerta TaxID=51695 RepID=A0A836B062_CHLIN|nr:hypothetical protein HXX76_002240 [Chlamydomonas incerta]|eukprot:KAG2443900.1 hypothetical protein HXX76_002240 [Chlamydomonas incerta]